MGSKGFVFCSVICFDTHIPTMRHREAWAEEEMAPSREQAQATEARAALTDRPTRRVVGTVGTVGTDKGHGASAAPATTAGTGASGKDLPRDVLVVASKLKIYVKAKVGMNTSDSVLGPLSDHLRAIADQAIENARADNRRTVLDRDIPKPRRGD
ncbi:MAG: hypothetical protein ACI8TX_000891 [Hyphomicrobiaceae bacterium]